MSNELVTIEKQKPSFMESIKALIYRIGNGDKKFKNGPMADLNKATEIIIKSDVPALGDDGLSLAKEMQEAYEKLVPGKESIANTPIFEAVTLSKKGGEREQKLSVIADLLKNQKTELLNRAKESLQQNKSVEKQTQVEKNIEEEMQQ